MNDRPTMRAQAHDPWVAVHALAEYLYCPRAALLATEEDDDIESPQHPRRADYVPLYFSEQPIIDRQRKVAHRLVWCSLVSLLGVALAIATWWLGFSVWLATASVICLLFLPTTFGAVDNLVQLRNQWMAANRAKPRAPSVPLEEIDEVNWWELRRAGFEAIQYRDVLSDERWKVAGRPWRVLRQGDLRIPVFRTRSDSRRIRDQHLARAAAYCYLLETCEGANSPYAVLLFSRSYSGVAIPNCPRSRKRFHQALVALRSLLAERIDPSPPHDNRACLRCPHGYPMVHRPDETETKVNGEVLPVIGKTGVDGRWYHSPCGDRFRWLPPHARATEKQLGRR